MSAIHSYRPKIIVYGVIVIFTLYFSLLSLGRVRQLWASYFDLGIMHQTVYNSYMSLREADASRMLELTDPHGSGRQIKRMAIHNDVILGLLAPLYFIYEGPETLLIFQILVTASGAYALYKIAQKRQLDRHSKGIWLWFIPLLYLLYPPLERSERSHTRDSSPPRRTSRQLADQNDEVKNVIEWLNYSTNCIRQRIR